MATPATEAQSASSLDMVGGLERLLNTGLDIWKTSEQVKAAKSAAVATQSNSAAAASGGIDTKTLLIAGGVVVAFGLGLYFFTK